jgi:type II secretory pathway component PulF
MGMFSYIAKNKEGQEIRSSIEAGTRLEALEALRKKGLTVVDLFGIEHEKAGAAPKETVVKPEKKSKRKSFQSAKVRMGDLAIFCRQLAISVNAGVPLRDALDTIGQELEHPRLQAAVMDMVGKLNDGKSFSEAVTEHPKIFNVMFCGLIKVAEESGKLRDFSLWYA